MEIYIKEYLDCENQVFTPGEIDKLSESDAAKSKTAKQLMGVAKQFGSIGKSVSKKFLSMTKRPKSPPASNSGGYGDTLLCVRIRSKRHQFADQMLQNYLEEAHERYDIIHYYYCYYYSLMNVINSAVL
jgi:OTU domain-containing protein 7